MVAATREPLLAWVVKGQPPVRLWCAGGVARAVAGAREQEWPTGASLSPLQPTRTSTSSRRMLRQARDGGLMAALAPRRPLVSLLHWDIHATTRTTPL